MANTVIPLGSKEYFFVDVDDFLNVISDLTGLTVTFSVKDGSNTLVITNQAISNISSADGGITFMRAWCLIDTSSGFTAGDYRLYLKLIVGSEAPIIGPLTFTVSGA